MKRYLDVNGLRLTSHLKVGPTIVSPSLGVIQITRDTLRRGGGEVDKVSQRFFFLLFEKLQWLQKENVTRVSKTCKKCYYLNYPLCSICKTCLCISSTHFVRSSKTVNPNLLNMNTKEAKRNLSFTKHLI